MNISYSFGMADLIHFGHIIALKKASENSDLSVFGLVSDVASDAWFGSHVSNFEERKAVLQGIRYIDEVWEQSTFDPLDNLRKLHTYYPNAIITLYVSGEWSSLSAKKFIESINGRVIKLDYYNKLSPQAILEILNDNEIKSNTKLLEKNLISTKANTLQSLKGLVKKGFIEDLFIVSIEDFIGADSNNILSKISNQFKGNKIVVRSSSKREDAYEESNAGHFASVLNVDSSNSEEIKQAIETVIDSYGVNPDKDEQILIQNQTQSVKLSGVVFTKDIQHNRPYYVINYDDSGSTDSVTSGIAGKTVWISNSASEDSIPQKWLKLMEVVWELENILFGTLLDIEFAITDKSVVIFQVRPLAAAYKFGRKNNEKNIEVIKEKVKEKYKLRVSNGSTCFSDMAFWNPAEIIGDNPKNLDYSLYREIITKEAWNIGLLPLGYRSVPKELMHRFGNKPYINVERSFESLMPASISDTFVKRLKFYYVEQLKKDLSSHDKIEFEISHNCFDFSLHGKLLRLMDDGFSFDEINELESALKSMTVKTINKYGEILYKDQQDLKILECSRLDIQNLTKETKDYRLLAKSIRTLIEAIVKFGTPQFARHARCAFIAKSLCRSLVNEKYISPEQFNQFMSSIKTIAVDYERDYHEVLCGVMTKEHFCSIYGHLRAGTYNIRSPRYDQLEQLFSSENIVRSDIERTNKFRVEDNSCITEKISMAIEKALTQSEIHSLNSDNVVDFIKSSTEQREYFKFIFTKTLSFVLELIKKLGYIVGINENNLSYLELQEIYSAEYYSDIERLRDFWSLVIEKRKELYKNNSELILPDVICSEKDFDFVRNVSSRPNFITDNKVTAEVILLESEADITIDGKIVVIEKADPGYDWIFTKGIAGLVTKYGGAASHMAIRCAEFKIPAAIGCGVSLFDYAVNSKKLTVDCKHEKLIRIE